MRVYVAATLATLRDARKNGRFEGGAEGLAAYAVTPAVREWYTEGDTEELEFTALLDAAQAALGLLHDDPDTPRRRVVAAADVPDAQVTPGGPSRSSVQLSSVPLDAVVSLHVDEAEAEPTIAAAAEAVPAAADGDDDAQFLLDEAEACDLLWYDVTELDDLVRD